MTLHGAFADFEGNENVVNEDKIYSFEQLGKKKLSLATFSDNWFQGIRFPHAHATRMKNAGIIPVVRIMPRSNFGKGKPDPNFSLAAIASGKFDSELNQWATDCALFNNRVIVDFACEVNGTWFPWSKEDPRLYIKAFRKVYSIINAVAPQAEFVWHVNYDEEYQNVVKYFPGNDYVDYIGASIYGNYVPKQEPIPFAKLATMIFDILDLISAKPKAISEIGVTEAAPGAKAKWIKEAFEYIEASKRYQFVSWWHSKFKGANQSEYTNYRIDSSPEALQAYREAVSSPVFK